jgi:glycosyltransferase involved in cell wall biosynthesis
MPEVSVVIAVHNGEKTLHSAVDSIINQTFSNWELIIVNDASTDNTADIVKSYQEKYDNIIYIRNTRNSGLAKSLNSGIEAASGRYIARLDDDDICFPARLEKQYRFMEKHKNIDVLGTGAVLINNNGEMIGALLMPESDMEIRRQIPKLNPFIHPSVMMKREFAISTGGYDARLKRKEDYDLWARGINKHKYHNIAEPLIYYRVKRSKTFYTDMYGFWIRLRNAYRGRYLLTGIFWAIIVLSQNVLRKLGYRQKFMR